MVQTPLVKNIEENSDDDNDADDYDSYGDGAVVANNNGLKCQVG